MEENNLFGYPPEPTKEIPVNITDKGIMVDIENYYELIHKVGYENIPKEETADFLGKLKAANRFEEIKKYFVSTIKHPYLCRTQGDKEPFTPEEYAKYYYSAVAVREINDTTHYFGHAIATIRTHNLALLLRVEEYETAVAFTINAKEMRATLGEEAYKAIVPSLDDIAKNIGEGRYLQFKKGSGNYKVDAFLYATDLRQLVVTINSTTTAVKTSTASIEDTLKVLGIESFILQDVKKFIEETKEKNTNLIKLVTAVLNDLLKQQKKKEVREAYTRHLEANYLREGIRNIIPSIEEAQPQKGNYMQNLFLYSGNTYYIARLVDEYKKAQNEEGIL